MAGPTKHGIAEMHKGLAKGGLVTATAADVLAALAVGTDGDVLTADSAQAKGIKWAAPSGGGSSFGSNSNSVGSANAPGASSSNARADHVHQGVHQLTSNGSNGRFEDVNLAAGSGIALGVAGQTITVTNTGSSGGAAAGSSTTGIGWIDATDNPDKVPGSPSAQDDEFAAGSLDGKWTHTGAGTLTFVDSQMVVAHAASATDEIFYQSYVPGAGVAFTITAKFGGTMYESIDYTGLQIMDSGGSVIAAWDYRITGSGTAQLNRDQPGGSSTAAPPQQPAQFYLRISRDASNNYTGELSWDGIAWSTYGIASASSATAVGRIAMRFGQTQSRSYKKYVVDWFRRT